MEKEEEAQGKGPEGTRARPGTQAGRSPLPLPVEQQAGQEVVSLFPGLGHLLPLGSEQRFLEGKE